jgi:hypothetical protein
MRKWITLYRLTRYFPDEAVVSFHPTMVEAQGLALMDTSWLRLQFVRLRVEASAKGFACALNANRDYQLDLDDEYGDVAPRGEAGAPVEVPAPLVH